MPLPPEAFSCSVLCPLRQVTTWQVAADGGWEKAKWDLISERWSDR